MFAPQRLQRLGTSARRSRPTSILIVPRIIKPTSTILLPQPQRRYGSSSSATGDVKVDQTKESNSAFAELKSEHKEQAAQAGKSDAERGDHPAKQADPQQSPAKSTGVRYDGPESKAGEREDKGVMKDKSPMPSSGT